MTAAGKPPSRLRAGQPEAEGQLPVWREIAPRRRTAPGRAASSAASAPATSTIGEAGVDELLGPLNPEQRRVVTHGEGPLLVIAGAGTGKTQAITRRIAWLIATRRARPAEILALTFTDKAAAEMQARVDELVPYGYTDTAIFTFHAFGDRLIREFALELGLPSDVRVLSRPESVIFLRERLFELELDAYRPLGDPTRFLAALAALFSRCKDEDISPAAYLAHAERLTAGASAAKELETPEADALAEEARRQMELARAYERYQAMLAAAGFVDFGDQVSLALRLLRDSPAARRVLQQRYRYILVDEFQDTNRAQSELVALLAEGHRNVTVVGDDDQSIYTFRGAAIGNILGFRERYAGARQVVLRRNYRSRSPILDAAYRLIRFNDPDRLEVRSGIVKELIAQRGGRGAAPVRHAAFPTGSEEADWIAAEIRRRIDAGAGARDHAVLVRANADADPILRSLNMVGVPWRFSGTSGLYGQPEIRLLLAFLRTVADLSSTVDLYALAASDVYRLGGPDLTTMVATARRRNRSLWDVLEEVVAQPGILRLTPETRATVARLVEDLRRYVELSHERPAGEVLYRFLTASGLLARLARTESVAAEEALQNIARFFDIVRAQSGVLADDRVAFVAGHFQTLIEAGDDPASAEIDSDADAVAVVTVHKAKGLEFPVVFMPELVDGRFPGRSRRDQLGLPSGLVGEVGLEGDPHLEEERRLFYVGMTRARDELILSHATDYGGARIRRVSQFVLEALDLPIAAGATAGAPRTPTPLERLARFEVTEAPAEAILSGDGGPLTLSFYQVDDYLTCPLKYKYVHVLRVPIAPHHAIVYGAALHQAVQEFHRRQARGTAMDEAELLEAFDRAWSNEGFLSRAHEEARREAGRAALRRFRVEQLQPGAIVPAYVEREFSFTLGGDRIRGRWDRVDIERLPAADGGPAAEHDPEAVGGLAAAGGPPADLGPSAAGGPPAERGDAAVHADVLEPVLPGLHPERVTITDYKSSDVRDPAKARERARDSLQLTIYAMAFEAQSGRLPDAVQLYFLESGLIGRAEVDVRRLERARALIARAAAGIRAREFTPTPEYVACGYCAYREICPASAVK